MGLAILACLPPHAASAFGMTEAQTLIDKLWAAHEIVRREDGDSLLWVDRHYVHEGSFHAFSRLAERGVPVAEPGLTFGVADHYVPTRAPRDSIGNPEIARMVRQMDENAAKHRIKLFGLERSAARYCARGRARAGPDAARPADRLRRQPHLDPRRAWRICFWYRRLGSGACADDANDLAAPAQAHAYYRGRQSRARNRRQGHRARDHRQDRRRWRDQSCHRVRRAPPSARCRSRDG